MPTPDIGGVPFQEAIDHFRSKVSIPTEHFDEMMGATHAKAFTVAGATKMDLLTDLRSSVDQAIANGTTITEFRKQFDATVQKHGWSYNGERGWRTRVIFDNNLRTAHMAGRWQQFQNTKATRPFLQYLTAGDIRVRPEHREWNGLVLHIDDPFWDIYMTPNGYGCRCNVRSLSARQMRRDKLDLSQAPAIETTERINIRTGEVYGDVPKGIDTGWDYNVGKAWLGPEVAFGKKAMALPEAVRSSVLGDTSEYSKLLAKPFKSWADAALKRESAVGEIRTVGYLNDKAATFAATKKITTNSTITISDADLKHLNVALDSADVSQLPAHIGTPQAILWDKKQQLLAYVLNTDPTAQTRLLVEIAFGQKDVALNTVKSGGVVSLKKLRDTKNYKVIDGEI